MEIMTRDFGTVEIAKDEIIVVPDGLPGFTDYKEYVLLILAEDSPFMIFQSIEEPNLAFITIDPWRIIPDYEFEISKQVENSLKINNKEEVLVLVIGTIRKKLQDMTVNLAAPLVININSCLGKQVILEDDNFPLRQPVFQDNKPDKEVAT